MAKIDYPEFAKNRGVGYWLRPGNLWASRRKFLRTDHSIEWRKKHTAAVGAERHEHANPDARFSVPFSALLNPHSATPDSYRFVIMGDTGEGDRSQYALVPLLRALSPDFILIAGDIVYPVGKTGLDRDSDDYLAGVFEPYRDLGIPIWGVPGNHEYYCREKGKGFFEIFCSNIYAKRWEEYGLKLVQQPGALFELRQPGRRKDLVVIGLDTGLHGNLDGHRSWWQFWNRDVKPDYEQLGWLQERLEHAQREECKVILMFHIPSLGDQTHRGGAHLEKLHRMIGEFPCVRMVVVGHIHNYQSYAPDVFAHYLRRRYATTFRGPEPPHYIVCGGGGAYLNSTNFGRSHYSCRAYPDGDTWRQNVGHWRQLVDQARLSRTIVGRLASVFEKGALADADLPAFLSVMLVEVSRIVGESRIVVTPVFLDDIKDLFAHLPKAQAVSVMDPSPPFCLKAVGRCMQCQIQL